MQETKLRIISALIENEPGALSRVIGLFSQRGYNIDSLNVAPTDIEQLSRVTLTTNSDDKTHEQIVKQLNKLIDIVKVQEVSDKPHVEREFMLIKIKATSSEDRTEVHRIINVFRGKVVDIGVNYFTATIEGRGTKLDDFVKSIKHQFKILELARSGKIGFIRSDKAMSI